MVSSPSTITHFAGEAFVPVSCLARASCLLVREFPLQLITGSSGFRDLTLLFRVSEGALLDSTISEGVDFSFGLPFFSRYYALDVAGKGHSDLH